jgi:hypothetical protein
MAGGYFLVKQETYKGRSLAKNEDGIVIISKIQNDMIKSAVAHRCAHLSGGRPQIGRDRRSLLRGASERVGLKHAIQGNLYINVPDSEPSARTTRASSSPEKSASH